MVLPSAVDGDDRFGNGSLSPFLPLSDDPFPSPPFFLTFTLFLSSIHWHCTLWRGRGGGSHGHLESYPS